MAEHDDASTETGDIPSETGARRSVFGLFSGLSARALLLAVIFVMGAEVLIYAPSIARFRQTALQEILDDAYLAVQATTVLPDVQVADTVARRLLDVGGAHLIAVREGSGGRAGARMVIGGAPPRMLDGTVDLRNDEVVHLILEAFRTLGRGDDRLLRVIGVPGAAPTALVEAVIDERPLRAEMWAYSQRILLLSLFIAGVTGVLLYLALRWQLVAPMRRLTAGMAAFRSAPEDPATTLPPCDRRDELGVAQRELVRMQNDLRAALVQKTRLVGIGEAVTRFNHDVRNVLAGAMLDADRLSMHEDGKVAATAENVILALERATDLCRQSLKFARDGTPDVSPRPVWPAEALPEIAGDVPIPRAVALGLMSEEEAADPDIHDPDIRKRAWRFATDADLVALADPDQLFRVISNLSRNAFEAGATRLTVTGGRSPDGMIRIELADDGPGVPPALRADLFRPFATGRKGGTGLGLAIAHDLMRAQGGSLDLAETGPDGTTFRLTLPAAPE